MRYVYAVLGGLVLALGITVWWMLGTINHATGDNVASVQFVVEQGEQLRHVATRLESQHLVTSAGAWTLYTLSTGQRSAILAGAYTLNSSMTGRQILNTLTTNPLKDNEVSVTIREGLTLTQIAAQLERAEVVNGQLFLNLVQHPATANFDAGGYRIAGQKPATVDFEGYLFPDTYRFFKHTAPADVLKKLLANLDTKYSAELEQSTRTAGHTPPEILTIASILEAELKTTADRQLAADLFWRRVKIGMGLNADTTILYALGRTGGGVSSEDLKVVSPYNTYTNRGLPPGPINNPGLDAIKAAISPTPNDYLYYLTAPNGTTYFAKTLEEHNQNKAKYLK